LTVETDEGVIEFVTTSPAPEHLKGAMDTIVFGLGTTAKSETRDLAAR